MIYKISKCFFVSVMFLFIGCVNVKADVCDVADIARVKELAKNITVEYEYQGNITEQSDLQSYLVHFNFQGLDNVVSIRPVYDGISVDHSDSNFILESGKYDYDIIYDECNSKIVGNISFRLKKFNEYSLRDECKDLDVDVCDAWNQDEISEEEFLSVVSTRQGNSSFSLDIFSLVTQYYVYFIGVCVALIVIIVFLVIRNIKRNRLD